jgi:glyoxalase family protein
MNPTLLGLHHVTAMCSNPQTNIDFYTSLLGLQLVKLTVNFDDPQTYHLYYGDASGSPGSLITFFAWPGAMRGWHGAGQPTATAYAVPDSSLVYWQDRLGVRQLEERFGERVLALEDPDGLKLELIGTRDADPRQPWNKSKVSAEDGLRGFHSVTLTENDFASTASLLTDTLGYKQINESGNRRRFAPTTLKSGDVATYLDVVEDRDAPRGTMGVGTVHHIALRTPDEQQQSGWLAKISGRGLQVSPIIDRKYFHSIYFRESAGVLFEIATDPPGMTVDEPLEKLGSGLYLPPWLEPHRKELEAALPLVELPS